MIKEALQYIVGLKEPVVKEINGHTYSDKALERISYIPYASAIELSTLTSLVEYIKSNTDYLPEKMLVHVVSPVHVVLCSHLNGERKRETIAKVCANLPDFRFGRFIDTEEFVIALQSKFLANADRELVLKFAGTVEVGSVQEYGDDGVSQKASVKTGITSKSEAIVPNPVTLAPYRTFHEVAQPESKFIFRMNSDCGVQCALFEADGGAWQSEAMNNVKEYLKAELQDYVGSEITVIS